MTPGSYSVAIELPDLEHVKREPVMLSAHKTTQLDFSLRPRQPFLSDALTAEIAMGEPGTDDQRFLLTQCSECHSLQWALANPRTKEDWLRIVRLMAGPQASKDTPGTRQFMQRQYIQPLADYLASIRGPGAQAEIPFKLLPRPTSEASTRIVVTEYDTPRGGSRDLYMVRGAWNPYDWPHDLLVDSHYVWYTDHYSYLLGRLDKKTGEIKEFPYEGRFPGRRPMDKVPPGSAHQGVLFGSHKMVFDHQGNVMWGMPGATFRFDPKTERFTHWASGENMFGIDPANNIWYAHSTGTLDMLDTNTGEVKEYKIPPNEGAYDMEVDSHGRSIINIWRGGKTGNIGLFDPKTEMYTEYQTPSPGSGPRRGSVDANDREWVGLFWAGRLGMFNPNTGEVKEYPLMPDTKAFGPPFVAPYTAAVDDKHQLLSIT